MSGEGRSESLDPATVAAVAQRLRDESEAHFALAAGEEGWDWVRGVHLHIDADLVQSMTDATSPQVTS